MSSIDGHFFSLIHVTIKPAEINFILIAVLLVCNVHFNRQSSYQRHFVKAKAWHSHILTVVYYSQYAFGDTIYLPEPLAKLLVGKFEELNLPRNRTKG